MTSRRTFSTASGHRSGGAFDEPRTWNPLTLAALAGVWIAALPNWPLWKALFALPETSSLRGVLFSIGFGLMIAALMTALLACFAWRLSIKPVIAFMLLAAAFGAHFMSSYGVVIDTTMMTNVLQTDPREVRDLLSWRMVVNVMVLAGLPLILLWRVRVARVRWWPQAGRNLLGFAAALLLLAALIFVLFADLSTTMRNHRSMRYLINPVNSLYALGDLAAQSNAKPAGPPLPIGLDARITPRAAGTLPPMLMLVVGETARADHFSLNGYDRPTNPELTPLDVASFGNVMSCGTNTAASLPCMFSHLGKAGYESRERDHENLLDLVQRAGMAVLWIDNQAGCKACASAFPTSTPARTTTAWTPQCCKGWTSASPPARGRACARRVVGIASDGQPRAGLLQAQPADRKPFKPECTTNVLQQCDRAALINAYDNSIAYTDHVLASGIAWLKAQQAHFDTTLLYMSDHGESLGENNLYLHGLPYAVAPVEQKHVPMVWWPRSAFNADCLALRQRAPLTHDNLFHSTLGALGIQATEYKPSLDVLAGCRSTPAPKP